MLGQLRFFFFAMVATNIFDTSQSTTCSATTASTCRKSNHVTGTCDVTTQLCGCHAGYTAVNTGCGELHQAVVTAGSNDELSGEVHTDGTASLTLKCSLPGFDGSVDTNSYSWYLGPDFSIVAGATSSSYTVTDIADGASLLYSCAVATGPIQFSTSEHFLVRGYADGGTITERPVVSGLPSQHIANAELSMRCTNVPSDTTLTFSWNNPSSASSATLEETATSGSDVSRACEINSTGPRSFSSPTSAVAVSTLIDATGVRVVMEQGTAVTVYKDQSFPLSCAVEGDVALPTGKPVWAWQKNMAITGATSSAYTVPSSDTRTLGTLQFMCSADLDGSNKATASITITVESRAIEQPSIKSVPRTAVAGGHIALYCLFTATFGLGDVTYSWQVNSDTIPGQTDNVIQLSPVTSAFDGQYTCTVHKGDAQSSVSSSVSLTATEFSEIPLIEPFLNFLISTPYTLTCSTLRQETPGILYQWQVDSVVVGTGSEFTFTPTSTSTSLQCSATFGSVTKTVAVQIEGRNVLLASVNGPSQPLVGTDVTLTCNAELASVSPSPSYQWYEAGSQMVGQTSKTLVLDNVSVAGHSKAYKCHVVSGGDTARSRDFQLDPSASPAQPQVTSSTTELQIEGCYNLSCESNTDDPTATFRWTFTPASGGSATELPSVTNTFQISSASIADAGNYKCAITIGGVTSTQSLAWTISFSARQGKTCTNEDNCADPLNATWILTYSGNCIGGLCEYAPGVSLADVPGDATDSCAEDTATSLQCSASVMVLTSALWLQPPW